MLLDLRSNLPLQPAPATQSRPYSAAWLALQALVFATSFFSFSYDGSESSGAVLKLACIAFPLLMCIVNMARQKSTIYIDLREMLRKNEILFLIVVYGIFTSTWSPNTLDSFMRSIAFLLAALSLACLRVQADRMDTSRARTAIAVGFILAIAISMTYPTINPGAFAVPTPQWRDNRLGGWVIPPNNLGAFCAGMIGLCILQLQIARITVKNIVLLLAFSYVWYMTYSRGAIISTVIAVAVCSMYVIGVPDLRRRALIALWLTIMALTAYVIINLDNIDIVGLLVRGDGDRADLYTATSRTGIWGEVLGGVSDFSLIFGSGYAQASPTGAITFETMTTNHAHNGYIQILAGMGIVALIAFIVYVVSVLMNNIRYAKRSMDGVFALYVTLFFMMNLLVEASVGYQVYPQFAMFMLFAAPGLAKGQQSLRTAGAVNVRDLGLPTIMPKDRRRTS